MPSSSTERARRLLPWLGVAALSVALLLLLEGLASVLMAARAAKHTLQMREEAHTRYDADLGWSNQPGLRIADQYGGGTPFSVNAQGLRATEEYTEAVPSGRYRVLLLGDSFTMGYGVGDDATYPARMQADCPRLQTLNMGQGGYGLDQAFLWHRRDGGQWQADLLVVALIAQDLFRMASADFIGYAKPVLRARDGALVVENVPVPPTWDNRRGLRRLQAFTGGLALTETLRWAAWKAGVRPQDRFYGEVPAPVLEAAALALDEMAATAARRGQRFALVYLPTAMDVSEPLPLPEAGWMADYARRRDLPFVDLRPRFQGLPAGEIARLFRADDGHYSADGNRIVAAELNRQLAARVPGFPACGAP